MPRSLRLAVRSALALTVLAVFLMDGLGAVLLPGRFVLELLGALGPATGRHAVFLSGVFYGAAALASVVVRGQLLDLPDRLDA